ncbi:MAG: hypothetical protein H0V33_12770 [Acidimicrobiia bacterium]|nr:hypothetical protein [Acidimicrobiia bacterium]
MTGVRLSLISGSTRDASTNGREMVRPDGITGDQAVVAQLVAVWAALARRASSMTEALRRG